MLLRPIAAADGPADGDSNPCPPIYLRVFPYSADYLRAEGQRRQFQSVQCVAPPQPRFADIQLS